MGKPTVQKNVNLKTAFGAGKDIPPTVLLRGIATALASGGFWSVFGCVFWQNGSFDKLEWMRSLKIYIEVKKRDLRI